ncbi:MAG: hypothetical protein LBG81_08265 [Coriobacteriaceae bacterium]|jgi:hypothetical protein|nr:hypothetical protein [Coriobacteriaceae bacterium]
MPRQAAWLLGVLTPQLLEAAFGGGFRIPLAGFRILSRSDPRLASGQTPSQMSGTALVLARILIRNLTFCLPESLV